MNLAEQLIKVLEDGVGGPAGPAGTTADGTVSDLGAVPDPLIGLVSPDLDTYCPACGLPRQACTCALDPTTDLPFVSATESAELQWKPLSSDTINKVRKAQGSSMSLSGATETLYDNGQEEIHLIKTPARKVYSLDLTFQQGPNGEDGYDLTPRFDGETWVDPIAKSGDAPSID